MFARVRHPRLTALLLANAGTAAAVAYCLTTRPNPDGSGRVIVCAVPLMVVLYFVLWNAGLRFGIWFRQTPESPPVFVKARRHPLVVVLLLWVLLAGCFGILVLGWFGPQGQSWKLRELYAASLADTAEPASAALTVITLVPLDDFPVAGARALAVRLREKASAHLTVSVAAPVATGLTPNAKRRALDGNALQEVLLAKYSSLAPAAPVDRPPVLICLTDQNIHSETYAQGMMAMPIGTSPMLVLSAGAMIHELPDTPDKARDRFEERLAKTTRRLIWNLLLHRPLSDDTGDIFGASFKDNTDLDARKDRPLP